VSGKIGLASAMEVWISRKRYFPEQPIGMAREAKVAMAHGIIVSQESRQLSISEQTYYRWCKQYGGFMPLCSKVSK